ncbi:hypothetical protein [Gracilibacillus salinarum]|uniref:Uncharacterized protein n=1 Tax=Gracilibacillus salinarum TaxID=2932255 RepID=A0ABY4GGJ7_9BACI|nr:hypothetical protein [Gracilibacillus salinarum]UOQ83443.1 hypothetical protein MUN87_11785 [Gracilibacillus salinarum]
MNIVLVIIAGLLVLAAITSAKRLSGDGSSKDDERQKKILKDAALTSWQVIMLYAFICLMNMLPFVNELVDPSKIQHIAFFSNGGDILLIAILGYFMGGMISYFRYS